MDKAQQWARIKELFGAALEREPGQREAFLREACGQDEALRAEVASLLASDSSSGLLSENPLTEFVGELRTPTAIGPYVLVRKLGEGGMGQVWLAQQTAPVRRQVALKLIRAGMYDAALLQRFQAERQSLAVMDHPSIAKVFDAGTTPEGHPYLVMEFVSGPPITTYCDQNKRTIQERLELFIKVCEGVQHAHQKAVIHRDLKPANILVVEIDGRAVPRIIDFGLAKAAVAQSDAQTVLLTRAGVFLGTPRYMSPEQADPDVQDVDTRTDVYSLGVVLYELLTGSLPLEARQKPLQEILRQVREEEPPRPSTRIGKDRESSTTNAASRATSPEQLAGLLKGDLDWIVMRALEKDRSRRYSTPQELAADISRYLHHEPVIARPASTLYRARKYARRHRIGVSVAAGLALLLAGVTVLQAAQLRRITRERDRADRVTGFMAGMFRVSDPSEARGNSITAREILDKASRDIDTGLAQDPELQTQMMDVMGQVYGDLGLYPRALELLKRTVEIRRNVLGPRHHETLHSMDQLGWVLSRSARYIEAEKLQRETLAVRREVMGFHHPETLQSMTSLATTLTLEGHYADAEKLAREALEVQRRELGPERPDTLRSMIILGDILHRSGSREAEHVQRETIDIQRRVLGPEHPDTLRSMSDLGSTLIRAGRNGEAENVLRETLDARRRVLGSEHPETLVTQRDLATCIRRQGRFSEAEKLQRGVLEIQMRVLGPEHPNTLTSMNNLANTLNSEERPEEAEKLLRGALGVQRRTLGTDHPETLRSVVNLATCLRMEGHYAEAEKLGRETLEKRRRLLGRDHPDTALSAYNVAIAEMYLGKHQEAINLLREAVDHGLSTPNSLGIEKDPDLALLRKEPRFVELMTHVRERASSAQKGN